MIKFNKFNVVNTETKEKARVFYSVDNRTDKKMCVTIYAKDYDDKLGKMFASDYVNHSNQLEDLFDQGKVVLFENHPLYRDARKRALTNLPH